MGMPEITMTCVVRFSAEQGKMAMYRVRLDTTTNWAVSTTSVLSVLALSTQQVPHTFFILIALMSLMFLLVESRRFNLFSAFKARVRLLETGFYAGTVFPSLQAVVGMRVYFLFSFLLC
eukprot:m.210359 g.210359  ORF g.210359 m.210359 type:complete len:119 (+) comp15050_c0_seq15:749-1105(+)